jgi:SAM-dependent methyltransferase
MQPEEYAKMYHLEDTYWWFQGRLSLVADQVEQLSLLHRDGVRVLDLGCGTGLMLDYLNARCWSAGLDFSKLALDFSRRRGLRRLLQADAQALPVCDRSCDLVTALDLAEHVEHDGRMFAEIHRILRPGGRFVLTTPAHPFLWSDHDDALFHCRRYTREELRRKLQDVGFEVTRLTYCISFTFPAIVAFRLAQKAYHRLFHKPERPKTHVIQLPDWANRFLQATVQLETRLLRHFDLPFGVTLLAVLRKTE